jgi:hypothetical protein
MATCHGRWSLQRDQSGNNLNMDIKGTGCVVKLIKLAWNRVHDGKLFDNNNDPLDCV